MLVSLLANTTVSTGFFVPAWLAISVCTLFLLVGLFGRDPRYRLASASSEDSTSDGFLHTLECLTDSRVHRDTILTVLTNGDLEAYIFQRGEIAARYLRAPSSGAPSAAPGGPQPG